MTNNVMKKRLQRLLRHRDVCQKQRTSAEVPPPNRGGNLFWEKEMSNPVPRANIMTNTKFRPFIVVNISTNHGEIESHLKMGWLRLYLNRYQLGITAIRERYLLLDSFRGPHFVTSLPALFNYETTRLVTRTFYKLLY